MPGDSEVEMFPRLCHVGDADEATICRGADLGFNGVIVAVGNAAHGKLQSLAECCASHDLDLFLDIDFSEWDLHHEIVERHPNCFAVRREPDGAVVDPRLPHRGRGKAYLRSWRDLAPVMEWGESHLGEAIAAGAKGFRALHPCGASATVWTQASRSARERSNRGLIVVADTTGLPRSGLSALGDCGFDFTLSSLPWWNGRANWFIEEHQALSRLAPVLAQVDSPVKIPPASLTARRTRLVLAAITGSGFMVPVGFASEPLEDGDPAELDAFIRSINSFVAAEQKTPKLLLKATGAGANLTVLIRMEGLDPTLAGEAFVALVNPSPSTAAEPAASPCRWCRRDA